VVDSDNPYQPTIARISSSIVLAPNLHQCLEHEQRDVIPRYEAAPGIISVWLLQRPFVAYIEFVVLSIWQSEKAMQEFLETHSLPDFVGEGVIQLEPHTFEILLSRHGKSADAPGLEQE
jgi:hypothetical protein